MVKLRNIIVSFFVIIIVAIIALLVVVDPNDYREQIQEAVKDETGRELVIAGDLSLSVFPWLGIGVKDVRLGNSAGFEEKYFAQIQEASVKVKLLPLLSQQVEVSAVVLDGMWLNLAKNKAGISNWDDMFKPAGQKTQQSGTTTASPGLALGAITVAGLQIADATVVWDDASKGERYSLIDLDLTTDALSPGKPMAVDLAFTVESSKPKATVRLKMNANLLIDATLNKFDFQQMSLAVDVAGGPVSGDGMKMDITSHLTVDLAGSGGLSLNPLVVKFDDSTLSGSASVSHFSKPAIKFDLAIDTINIDRYLPKPTTSEVSSKKANGVAISPPAAAMLMPVRTMRDLDVDGVFKVQSLIVSGLTVSEASINVKAKNGVLKSEQAVKQFYNGNYTGEITVDVRQSTAKVAVKEQAMGVDVEPLLIDLLGESSIAGIANIKADVTMRGNTVAAFKKTLNGTAEFRFQDGAITGVDVGALIKQAQAVLKGDFAAAFVEGTGKTTFTEMLGSAQIINGLVSNKDLSVVTPLVDIKGMGKAHLVSEMIDYKLTLQRTKASSVEEIDSDDVKNILIPVNVGGTFSQPSVSLDVKGMVIKGYKGKIEKKKQELRQKLKDKIDKKLKGAVGELLKGLF